MLTVLGNHRPVNSLKPREILAVTFGSGRPSVAPK